MRLPLVDRFEAAASGWLRNRYARRARRNPALGLERVGTKYGGWVVPTARISREWVCYDGGVGEDASFATGLIERFGCEVFAFDPTPRAIAFVAANLADEPRFHFMAVGLWSEDTRLRFWAPRDPTHVSHSALNLQRTDEYFEAEARSVASLMRELGHETIDLFKVDIEGAEHTVIRRLLEDGVRPQVLCTEIDRPVGPGTFWSTMRRIRQAGYRLVAVDGWNFTFLRR